MTTARRQQINIEATPYYHCTSRCVRRAFLCGKDHYSGKSHEHRREWVESWLLKLNEVFCIDLVGYAVMSNHYHVILRINLDEVNALSDEQVIDRWSVIYKPDGLMSHYRCGGEVTHDERRVIDETLGRWRETLVSISRFMGYMNERIARQANEEDECKGRFWEGRFHSQALLDETALLQCMTYVDLNPIHAGIAQTPETSEYTSVKHRIDKRVSGKDDRLMAFFMPSRAQRGQSADMLPMTFDNYLELLDWTGRTARANKSGSIPSSCPDILSRLGFTGAHWMDSINAQTTWCSRALGAPEQLKAFSQAIGQHWLWRHRNASRLPTTP
ncbi:MAG: transposase [Gammaproteobacteria bacterium]|nr:transposase [Gammaproteobacteria bacterium]